MAQLGIGGYNDKLPVLLERVVSKMKDFEVDLERFNLVKDQVKQTTINDLQYPPQIKVDMQFPAVKPLIQEL